MLYNSRTITFMAVMAGLQAANVALVAFTDYIDPLIFASVSGLITVAIAVGGVFLRFATKTPIDKK